MHQNNRLQTAVINGEQTFAPVHTACVVDQPGSFPFGAADETSSFFIGQEEVDVE